jgi:DNA invertase Pin-like site-specific DNA recombinase
MNAKRQNDGKLTILYSRLSREYDSLDESGSIQTQKDIMEKFAKANGFTPFLHLSEACVII